MTETMKPKRRRGPRPLGIAMGTHSFRCTDEMWERARARAESEGYRMSQIMHTFVEGYAEGEIDMPRVTRRFSTASQNA